MSSTITIFYDSLTPVSDKLKLLEGWHDEKSYILFDIIWYTLRNESLDHPTIVRKTCLEYLQKLNLNRLGLCRISSLYLEISQRVKTDFEKIKKFQSESLIKYYLLDDGYSLDKEIMEKIKIILPEEFNEKLLPYQNMIEIYQNYKVLLWFSDKYIKCRYCKSVAQEIKCTKCDKFLNGCIYCGSNKTKYYDICHECYKDIKQTPIVISCFKEFIDKQIFDKIINNFPEFDFRIDFGYSVGKLGEKNLKILHEKDLLESIRDLITKFMEKNRYRLICKECDRLIFSFQKKNVIFSKKIEK